MLAWHTLGYLTLVAQFCVAGYAVRYLTIAGRESRSWLRKLPVPRASAAPLVLSSGTDYVGVV